MNVPIVTTETTSFLTDADEADLPRALVDTEIDPGTGKPARLVAMINRVRDAAAAAGSDVSSEKGRAAIRSAAAKIASSKTAVDKARKAQTEHYRAEVTRINGIGNWGVEQLQAIQDATRLPLTDWEASEKTRIAALNDRLQAIQIGAESLLGLNAEKLADVLSQTQAVAIDDSWDEIRETAAEVQRASVALLKRVLADVKQREDQAAELLRLQAAEAERQRLAAVEEARRKAEEDLAERERLQRERDEATAKAAREAAEREAAEKLAAVEREKAAAEQRARDAEEKAARDKADAEAAAEREAALAAERQAEALRKAEEHYARAMEAQRARDAEERRLAEEAEKARQQSKQRRAAAYAVMLPALEAAIAAAPDVSPAEAVADAIAAGTIPHAQFLP